ncbi:EamA-like transporter family protein [Panacagrimonas perspica]|uniref:EamA-like transporter family protein n=1 Tax=Panacagrimonas perspica TaxID=381431 RepID=A0A4R7P3N5_9GAMM|nr:DMT family transporter [Panacagrimonas perspica]TDU28383.1 EamA-like transporter family protein [Panacagrimonas perspica]
MSPQPASASASGKGLETGYLLAAVTILIWAGFVVVSRIAGKSTLTPFDVAALRIGTAALVLSPWWVPRLLNPALRQLRWYQSALFAALAGVAYPLVCYEGFVHAPASHGAVLISGTMPFFTTIFAFVLLGERAARVRLLGLSLIAAGVAAMFAANFTGAASAASSGSVLFGDLMFVCASALWSLFGTLLKFWKVRAFTVTLGVVAFSAMFYLPIYALALPKNLLQTPMEQVVLQAVFQGVIVVCVAMWTYAKAAELIGPSKLAVLTSLVPATATLMAIPILGESLSAAAAIGVALTSIGALMGAMARTPEPRGS